MIKAKCKYHYFFISTLIFFDGGSQIMKKQEYYLDIGDGAVVFSDAQTVNSISASQIYLFDRKMIVVVTNIYQFSSQVTLKYNKENSIQILPIKENDSIRNKKTGSFYVKVVLNGGSNNENVVRLSNEYKKRYKLVGFDGDRLISILGYYRTHYTFIFLKVVGNCKKDKQRSTLSQLLLQIIRPPPFISKLSYYVV